MRAERPTAGTQNEKLETFFEVAGGMNAAAHAFAWGLAAALLAIARAV